jgi:hypothetical protein
MPAWVLVALVGIIVGWLLSWTLGVIIVVIAIFMLLAGVVPR